MDSQFPQDAVRSIEESKVILEHFRDASRQRMELFCLLTQHLHEVVIPAVEELAAEFAGTLLEFEIDKSHFQPAPQLNVRAKLTLLPSQPPLSVGFRYEPSPKNDLV